MNKDQDTEVISSPEMTVYFSEYHEVTVSGAKDEANTQKTPDYFRKMDLDVANIDKNDKNTRKTIYKAIDAPYFGWFKIFTKSFLNQCKKYPNKPQNIPTDIKLKKCIRRKFLYTGG